MMDGLRKEFFPGTGLSDQQDRPVMVGGMMRERDNRTERGRVADQVGERVRGLPHELRGFWGYRVLRAPRNDDESGLVSFLRHRNDRSRTGLLLLGEPQAGFIGLGRVTVHGRQESFKAEVPHVA